MKNLSHVHRHMHRVTIIAAFTPENKRLCDLIADFAISCLKDAEQYAVVKRGVDSTDLLVNPISQETK